MPRGRRTRSPSIEHQALSADWPSTRRSFRTSGCSRRPGRALRRACARQADSTSRATEDRPTAQPCGAGRIGGGHELCGLPMRLCPSSDRRSPGADAAPACLRSALRPSGVAQLFHRRFGFLFRLGLIGVALAATTGVLLWRASMAYPAGVERSHRAAGAFQSQAPRRR